jgi:hypothetical protein
MAVEGSSNSELNLIRGWVAHQQLRYWFFVSIVKAANFRLLLFIELKALLFQMRLDCSIFIAVFMVSASLLPLSYLEL